MVTNSHHTERIIRVTHDGNVASGWKPSQSGCRNIGAEVDRWKISEWFPDSRKIADNACN